MLSQPFIRKLPLEKRLRILEVNGELIRRRRFWVQRRTDIGRNKEKEGRRRRVLRKRGK